MGFFFSNLPPLLFLSLSPPHYRPLASAGSRAVKTGEYTNLYDRLLTQKACAMRLCDITTRFRTLPCGYEFACGGRKGGVQWCWWWWGRVYCNGKTLDQALGCHVHTCGVLRGRAPFAPARLRGYARKRQQVPVSTRPPPLLVHQGPVQQVFTGGAEKKRRGAEVYRGEKLGRSEPVRGKASYAMRTM